MPIQPSHPAPCIRRRPGPLGRALMWWAPTHVVRVRTEHGWMLLTVQPGLAEDPSLSYVEDHSSLHGLCRSVPRRTKEDEEVFTVLPLIRNLRNLIILTPIRLVQIVLDLCHHALRSRINVYYITSF